MCLNEWMWGLIKDQRFLLPIPSQVVQHSHVGIGVVEVVWVGWVVFFCPVDWQRTVKIENVVLRFRLIVHAVEAHHLSTQKQQQKKNSKATIIQPLLVWIIMDFLWSDTHMLQEEVQLRMTTGVDRGFKQRHKDILQHLLEISQLLLCVVHITGEVVIEQLHLLLPQRLLLFVFVKTITLFQT